MSFHASIMVTDLVLLVVVWGLLAGAAATFTLLVLALTHD